MTEALVKLRTSTATLSETLRSKEEAYSKMIENNREAYEQRKNELETLTNVTRERATEKMTRETELKKEGEMIQEQHLQEHLERKANLQKEIAALTKQLETKQETNRQEEAKLTSQYESADKMYIEMLDTYDVEMQNH